MKKLILISLLFVTPSLGNYQSLYAATFKITVPDREVKIVEDNVISAEQWLKDAWAGKVNNSKSHTAEREKQRLIKLGAYSVPAKEDDLVDSAFSQPDYKNRKQRDEEEESKIKK